MTAPAEDNFVDFKCPHCATTVSFPSDLLGRAQSCPICLRPLILPAAGTNQDARPLSLPIKTPRLLLRRLEPGDWKDLLEVMSDEELLRYTSWAPMDEDQVMRWIEADAEVQLTQSEGALLLALEDTTAKAVVGLLVFRLTDITNLQGNLVVLINRRFQRKGYGLEAVRGILTFAFNDLLLHRIVTNCDHRNSAFFALLEKAGFRREAEFREDRFHNGEWCSTACHAMLAREHQVSGRS